MTETEWHIEAAAGVLRAVPNPITDAVDGSGVRFHFEQPSPAQLDLFPESLVARYRSTLAEITLRQVSRVSAEDKAVRIESGAPNVDAFLTIANSGSIHFNASTKLSRIGYSNGAETSAAPADPSAPAVVRSEEVVPGKRVTFTGRLGFDPKLEQTKNGKDRAKLSVAVRREGEDQPDWKDVYFFEERARTAVVRLKKGQMVNVIAFEHTRQTRGRKGLRTIIYYIGTAFSLTR